MSASPASTIVADATTYDRLLAGAMQAHALPRAEARMLLVAASGRPAEWLIAHGDDDAAGDVAVRFAGLAARRGRGEPVAYLTGIREFHGRRFRVGPAVQDVLLPDDVARALGRATTVQVVPGERAQLTRHFSVAAPHWPVAALTRQRDVGDAAGASWLRADPACMVPDMHGARMMALSSLDWASAWRALRRSTLPTCTSSASLLMKFWACSSRVRTSRPSTTHGCGIQARMSSRISTIGPSSSAENLMFSPAPQSSAMARAFQTVSRCPARQTAIMSSSITAQPELRAGVPRVILNDPLVGQFGAGNKPFAVAPDGRIIAIREDDNVKPDHIVVLQNWRAATEAARVNLK